MLVARDDLEEVLVGVRKHEPRAELLLRRLLVAHGDTSGWEVAPARRIPGAELLPRCDHAWETRCPGTATGGFGNPSPAVVVELGLVCVRR